MLRFPPLKELEPVGAQLPCVLVVELPAPEELRLIGVAGRLDPPLNTLRGERDAIGVAVPLVERRIAGAGVEVGLRLHYITRDLILSRKALVWKYPALLTDCVFHKDIDDTRESTESYY